MLLFIILVGIIFINSGLFAIKEFVVRGNQEIPSEDILLTARLDRYKNFFQVDVDQIRREILHNPKVASAEVTRVFPHKIMITIKERQPVCLLLYLDNWLVVGDDSVVMAIKDESDPINLPIVTGVKYNRAKVGVKILDSRFKTALEILKCAAADENLRQNISEINLSNFQVYLDLPNSHQTLKVEMGNGNQIEQKINNLRAILSQTSVADLAKVDLRVPDLPTVIRIKKTNLK